MKLRRGGWTGGPFGLESHGHAKRGAISPEYSVWKSMRKRCYDQKHPHFADYGGRGIRVCDEWRDSFESFFRDVGKRPVGLTLNRIDNDGDYIPGNVEWASKKAQARNTRRSSRLEFAGETKTIAEWAEIRGLSPETLRRRIKSGWDTEKALSIPPGKNTSSGGQKGVSWNKKRDAWTVYADIDGKRKHLGFYVSLEEALAARLEWEATQESA